MCPGVPVAAHTGGPCAARLMRAATPPGSGANYKFLTVNNFTQEAFPSGLICQQEEDAGVKGCRGEGGAGVNRCRLEGGAGVKGV